MLLMVKGRGQGCEGFSFFAKEEQQTASPRKADPFINCMKLTLPSSQQPEPQEKQSQVPQRGGTHGFKVRIIQPLKHV